MIRLLKFVIYTILIIISMIVVLFATSNTHVVTINIPFTGHEFVAPMYMIFIYIYIITKIIHVIIGSLIKLIILLKIDQSKSSTSLYAKDNHQDIKSTTILDKEPKT